MKTERNKTDADTWLMHANLLSLLHYWPQFFGSAGTCHDGLANEAGA